jgi:putative flippase GtrA
VSPVAERWLKFNFVGAVGIAVQFAALALFADLLHLNYLAATALAVETAVLHNFLWHQRFTWKHLPRGAASDVALRLFRFHLGNGLVSIAGNLLLMRLLTGSLHLDKYPAAALAIAVCALANFTVSEWFVFRR